MRWRLGLLVVLAVAAATAPFAATRDAADKPAPGAAGFRPVPLPDPRIPGFKFPEDESTILKWTTDDDQKAISRHAWGLWTALTSKDPSGQTYDGQDLLVFETWATPQNLQTVSLVKGLKLDALPRDPRPLGPLHQLRNRRVGADDAGQSTVLGFVKYDPTAASHIRTNGLFSRVTLNNLLAQGKTQVPNFENNAISLKVVFRPLEQTQLVDGRYCMLPAWPGPPPSPKAFPETAWGQCVWVDVQESGLGPGTGKVDTVCSRDGSSRTDATTYGLGRFMHFRMSAGQAHTVNAVREALDGSRAPLAAPENYAVLVGMHVTTREITRWTWQTFWWTPDPDNPPAPSSKLVAGERPAQLTGAARNYAHASAYGMVKPPQPNTGGANVGDSVYAYNPYLEAPFGPADLPTSAPGKSQGKPVANNVGVQTNCMSCHAQACYSPKANFDPALYTGDRYIDLDGSQFKGNLKADFLWTIPDDAR